MKRWQLYFKTDHLPPHLRAISEPFGQLAAAIVECGDPRGPDECLYDRCHDVLRMALDAEEAERGRDYLDQCVDSHGGHGGDPVDEALPWLLAAKDCAVRANIPDPVTA